MTLAVDIFLTPTLYNITAGTGPVPLPLGVTGIAQPSFCTAVRAQR
jgi:hypothetical protein